MKKIAVIGLGYVGLPLAVEFGKTRQVIGFDINNARVEQLKSGEDVTNECSVDQLKAAKNSLTSVEGKILKTHIEDCVKESLSGHEFEEKVDEIIKTLKR